jgi:hypothetical protein
MSDIVANNQALSEAGVSLNKECRIRHIRHRVPYSGDLRQHADVSGYGKDAKEAGPGGQRIPAEKLAEIAGSKIREISYIVINN